MNTISLNFYICIYMGELGRRVGCGVEGRWHLGLARLADVAKR